MFLFLWWIFRLFSMFFSSFALPMFLHPRPYICLLWKWFMDTLPSDLSNSCSSETLFLPHYCMIGYLDIKITLPVIFPQCLFQDDLASFINLNSFIYNLFSLSMIVTIVTIVPFHYNMSTYGFILYYSCGCICFHCRKFYLSCLLVSQYFHLFIFSVCYIFSLAVSNFYLTHGSWFSWIPMSTYLEGLYWLFVEI